MNEKMHLCNQETLHCYIQYYLHFRAGMHYVKLMLHFIET